MELRNLFLFQAINYHFASFTMKINFNWLTLYGVWSEISVLCCSSLKPSSELGTSTNIVNTSYDIIHKKYNISYREHTR